MTIREMFEQAFEAGEGYGNERNEFDDCPDFDTWWQTRRGEIINNLLCVAAPDATGTIDLTNTDIKLMLAAIGCAMSNRDFGSSDQLTGLVNRLYDLF